MWIRSAFVRADGRLRAGWRLGIFAISLAGAGAALDIVTSAFGWSNLGAAEGDLIVPGALLLRGLLSVAATLGAIVICLKALERRSLSTVGLPFRQPWIRGVGAGALLGAAPVLLLTAAFLLTGGTHVSRGSLDAVTLGRAWLPAALGLALVSAQEELMLRGYALQLLSEGAGRWTAAIVTGALFGVAHAGNPGATMAGVLNTAVNAALLAGLIMRTGSLWIACGYHAGWNLTAGPVLGLRLSGIRFPASLFETTVAGPDWLTGGTYGFEGSLLAGPIELVILAAAVALAARLPGHPELRTYFGAPSPGPTEPSNVGAEQFV